MGAVWRARDERRGIDVAVKLLLEHDSPRARSRFVLEALAPVVAQSDHVVRVLDSGTAPSGTPYLVMELLRGEDLGAYLRRVDTLPPAVLVAVVDQVATALSLAHERGIVHRDVKPSNLFLCESPNADRSVFVKVLDFGIAKDTAAIATQTASSATVGTPHYMSPEQLLGRDDVDARADIWALGVLAFRALTGRRPFEGETVGALTVAVVSCPPPRPSTFAPALTDDVDRWFLRACSVKREDRFGTILEAATALARALGVAPEDARRATLEGRAAERDAAGESPGVLEASSPTLTETPRARRVSKTLAALSAIAVAVAAAAASVGRPARTHALVPPQAPSAAPSTQRPAPSTPLPESAPSSEAAARPDEPHGTSGNSRRPRAKPAATARRDPMADAFHMPEERF
jgi:serine/threonine-protein kinase